MRPQLFQGQLRPQISTMPRKNTEAAAYLEIYKLVNERTRLQKELDSLDDRRDRLEKRLEVINGDVVKLESTAHQLRGVPSDNVIAQPQATKADDFNTFQFDY